MTDNLLNKTVLSKRHRPIGVWIITIYELIFTGIFALLGTSGMVLRGEVAMFSSDDVPHMRLRAYLMIGIIIASILTWMGWELGRKVFLLLTSIYYLLRAEYMFSWIISPHFWKIPSWEIDDRITSVCQLIGFVLILILYIWYFNKPSTRAFYRKVEIVT